MFPFHGCMGPYQHPSRNQLPHFMCYPYTSLPVAPPMYGVDAPNGLYSSSCSFDGHPMNPNEVECSGCCLHKYPSLYYSMPLYPPYQHPFYAHYPPMHPLQPHSCCVPTRNEFNPALNNTEQGKPHFCGWYPNHTSNTKEGNIPKIQEGNIKDGKYSDGNSMKHLPSYHTPITWFPPKVNNVGNEEKPLSQPGFWNAWYPLDASNFKGSIQGKEEEKSKDDNNQWCFPIICTPSQAYNDLSGRAEKDNEIGASPKIEEVPQSKSKIIQVKHPATDCDSMITIPVKQLKLLNTEQPSNFVKQKEHNVETVTSMSPEQESKMESKSSDQVLKSQKSSKLPPICLRVDPLPKKDRNSSPRSRNPPNHTQDDRKTKPFEVGEKPDKASLKKKMIEVKEKVEGSYENNQVDEASKRSSSVKVVPIEEGLSESKKAGVMNSVGEPAVYEKKNDMQEGNEASNNLADTRSEDNKGNNRNHSEHSAAIIIQAAYRGFQVRRCEPMKKLKQIGRIHKQVCDIRGKINAIEAASLPPLDRKEKVIIGETIMSLLLQLDTVQGMHPSVRETRKSVARELVHLQEKLDSLADQGANGGTCKEEVMPIKQEELLQNETCEVVHHITGDGCLSAIPVQYEGCKEISAPPAAVDAVALQSPVSQAVLEGNEVVDCKTSHVHDEVDEQNAQKVSRLDGVGKLGDCTFTMQEGSLLEEPPVTLHVQGEESHMSLAANSEEMEENMEAPVEIMTEGCSLEDSLVARQLQGEEELLKLAQANIMADSRVQNGGPVEIMSESTEVYEPPICEGDMVKELVAKENTHMETDTIELSDRKMIVLNELVADGGSQQQGEVDELLPLKKESHAIWEQQNAVELETGASHTKCRLHRQECTDFDEYTSVKESSELRNANVEEVRISTVKDVNMDMRDMYNETWKEHTCPRLDGEVSDLTDGCKSKRIHNNVGEDSLVTEVCRGPEPGPVTTAMEEEPELLSVGCKLQIALNDDEKKLVEQNVQLRDTLRELLARGKEQIDVISNLTGRVRDLERKLAHRRRLKLRTKSRRSSAFSRR